MNWISCLATGVQNPSTGTVPVREESYHPNTETILYIDSQRLIRDCLAEQLAVYLPEVLVERVSTVHELSKEGIDANRFPLGILNKHSARVSETEVTDQLSFLAATAPHLALVLLSDLNDANEVAAAFKLGVRGYIPTDLPIAQAVEAIRLVSAGGSFLPASLLSLPPYTMRRDIPPKADVKRSVETFTPRQMEVLRRLWQGKQNKLIAYDLDMCESTVKVHIRHIMKKLNARNRTQVVLLTRSLYMNEGASAAG